MSLRDHMDTLKLICAVVLFAMALPVVAVLNLHWWRFMMRMFGDLD